MSYFINGQFWQEDEVPQERAGKLVSVSRSIEAHFHGFIGKEKMEPVNDEGIDGYITDMFGQSSVTDFVLDATTLTFTKKYTREGSAPVLYNLIRGVSNDIGNQFFVGAWGIGIADHIIASGKARCVLTPIPEHFFTKPE